MSDYRGTSAVYAVVPSSPGEVLRVELASRGLTQAAFAEQIGRPAQVVNEIVNGKKVVTAATARDFERVLGIEAGFWCHLQADYSLHVAQAWATS